jgi:hypothetical protein
MRNHPDPQTLLAACLGISAAELRRTAPYRWWKVSDSALAVAWGEPPGRDDGVWFLMTYPTIVVVGVLPDSVVVGPSPGTNRSVCWSRNDPDLHRAVPSTIARIVRRQVACCVDVDDTAAVSSWIWR